MARLLVVTSSPPFIEGGHLVIARALVSALRDAGHQAELLITPQNRFGRQGSAYLATWLTDVGVDPNGRSIDQVISLRYPSYAVRHPAHVCWLNHTMREYYDRWEAFSAGLNAPTRLKERTRRRLIHLADRYLLTRNVRRLFAQSKTVQARLARWGGIASEVLYPPPPPRPYRVDDYGDYIFVVSRLAPLKRIDLVIAALARPEASGVRCLIAGEGEERQRLQHAIDAGGLSGRVRLLGRIDDAELVDHLARCRAVCFPPQDEDYGFVTSEAFASRKPVITCRDSGGAAELVTSGVNGILVRADPGELGAAMRMLLDDRARAERLGEAGYKVARGLRWSETVEKLVVV